MSTGYSPPEPAQGYVNITVEIFDYKGVRTNIVRETFTVSGFLDGLSGSPDKVRSATSRLIAHTVKEILSPSIKTEMA